VPDNKFPVGTELEGELPCSEDSATGTDSEHGNFVHAIAQLFI
jgi:hypothetical protein